MKEKTIISEIRRSTLPQWKYFVPNIFSHSCYQDLRIFDHCDPFVVSYHLSHVYSNDKQSIKRKWSDVQKKDWPNSPAPHRPSLLPSDSVIFRRKRTIMDSWVIMYTIIPRIQLLRFDFFFLTLQRSVNSLRFLGHSCH